MRTLTVATMPRWTGVHACLVLYCVLAAPQAPPPRLCRAPAAPQTPPTRLCRGISLVAAHPRALGNALALGLAADAVYPLPCASRKRCVLLWVARALRPHVRSTVRAAGVFASVARPALCRWPVA